MVHHAALVTQDTLASLPDTTFAGTRGNDVNIGFSLQP
jgi:hypothetical protein